MITPPILLHLVAWLKSNVISTTVTMTAELMMNQLDSIQDMSGHRPVRNARKRFQAPVVAGVDDLAAAVYGNYWPRRTAQITHIAI